MQYWIICSFLLLNLSSSSALAEDYTVRLTQRGLVFSQMQNTQLTEPQLCFGNICLFVEKRELDLIGVNLGDNAQQIFTALKQMDDLDKAWLFGKLNNLDRHSGENSQY